MTSPFEHHGSVVAFEGPEDAISTQLRLLPTSPNILIVPSLQQFIKTDYQQSPFDVRSHILRIHKAASDRGEFARAFLQSSTPNNKRLVFMNGGTARAQVECISGISKYHTDGDVAKAESIFNELVQGGVAGLQSQSNIGFGSESRRSAVTRKENNERGRGIPNDPVSKAMRAADALDIETASLQPNNELDLTVPTRPRSTSVPICRMVDEWDAAPFYVFGTRESSQTPSLQQGEISITHDLEVLNSYSNHTDRNSRIASWRSMNPDGARAALTNGPPSSPSCIGEEYPKSPWPPSSNDVLTLRSTGNESIPATPTIIGEAVVLDIRTSISTTCHKRTKSVDRIYANATRNQDISLCQYPQPPQAQDNNSDESSTRSSILGPDEKPRPRSKFFSEIPRSVFNKPSKAALRRGPPPPLNLRTSVRRSPIYADKATNPRYQYVHQSTGTESVYVDRGTDAEYRQTCLNTEDGTEFDSNVHSATVLPMVEDLVIYFKGEEPSSRLEATIQAFQEGKYPVSEPSLKKFQGNNERISNSNVRDLESTTTRNGTSMSDRDSEEVDSIYQPMSDEYDPFAAHENCLQPPSWPPRQKTSRRSTSIPTAAPPTPAHTPPPTAKKPDKRFHEFTTTGFWTAVSMQNSLRCVLNVYFPPEDTGYHQFNFPLLPELSSLWKPVFRETQHDSPRKQRRRIDLILAIGAQKGVDREFLGAITGSLEKLGTKPNGMTRSGRLDLRYLIANAMQSFTAQPLANQTQDNPFSNPLLLATLIIPHLETYMAAHSATRFLLLEYPPEHLTTVLALQRLVGLDLLKVAGILDSEANEPKPYTGFKAQPWTSPMSAHSNFKLSTMEEKARATLLAPKGLKSTPTPSFSRANFLLTSSATESEIASLISTIWKILVDVSPFYVPEGIAPKSPMLMDQETKRNAVNGSQHRPLAQTPLIDPSQQYAPLTSAAIMMGFREPTSPSNSNYVSSGTRTELNFPLPPSRIQNLDVPRSETPMRSSRASVAGSIRSIRTTRTMQSQRNKLRTLLGKDADVDRATIRLGRPASSVFSYDDDEFADEERKYMPLFGGSPSPRKGNSHKALKWLGLST
ncbi:hypothetical protein F5B20DRAFT_295810 [Whalleya microplaca]|nr:hypothetical protein F5B20DRAFT_295810 [Whalleya microplaca]